MTIPNIPFCPRCLRLASLGSKMDSMQCEDDVDEDDEAAGEAMTGPLSDAFSGLQGESGMAVRPEGQE